MLEYIPGGACVLAGTLASLAGAGTAVAGGRENCPAPSMRGAREVELPERTPLETLPPCASGFFPPPVTGSCEDEGGAVLEGRSGISCSRYPVVDAGGVGGRGGSCRRNAEGGGCEGYLWDELLFARYRGSALILDSPSAGGTLEENLGGSPTVLTLCELVNCESCVGCSKSMRGGESV